MGLIPLNPLGKGANQTSPEAVLDQGFAFAAILSVHSDAHKHIWPSYQGLRRPTAPTP